jgi:PKD repeat protein
VRLTFRVGLLIVVAAAVAVPSAFGVSVRDTITTLAGTGTAGFAGDGGQATSAQLNLPTGVAVDGQGNLYIADYVNHRIRKVSSGIITTVAGTGTAGYSGDGGQATSAQLDYPFGVAVDAQGNLYIADQVNQRIRKVSGGIITTVAGTGTAGYSGDGGQATSAQLNNPIGVAVDGQGNLYIADYMNHRIRKVSSGIITTVAGTGTAGYSGDGGQATSAQLDGPVGVGVDAQGSVYIADQGNQRIRKLSGGIITTVAGTGTAGFLGDGGQATSAQLNSPFGVAVDGQGNLYIADASNHRVRKVSGGIITTVAGTGTSGYSGDGGQATSAQISEPVGVAVDGQGNLYIADYDNQRIRKVSGGIITTVAGTGTLGFSGDGGQAASAQLYYPHGVAVDGQGSVYLGDSFNHRVRKIENKLPTASINASPSSGQAPLTVNFDGSASADPDGQIAAYAWAFGDGGTATGATASHQYTSAGTYTAKLTVTDDSGATVSTAQPITVSAPPPPPPPPTAPKLTAGKLTVGKAVAGKAFTVSTTVKNAKTGKGVKGQVSCTGKLNGKPLPATHHSSSTNGNATCSWQLPKTAHGKRFTGTITDTYKGAKISRAFSVTVA